MADPVSLAEAKLFLRVTHSEEDALISTFLEASQTRLEAVTDLTLSDTSPAPLRLALMYLVAQAYANRGEVIDDLSAVEAWLTPYRTVRV